MKIRLGLLATFLLGIIASGCVTAETFQFDPNTSEASEYEKSLVQNRDNYATCLYASSYFIKSKFGFLPDRKPILEDCSAFRSEYHKSLFYSAFGGYRNKSIGNRYRELTAKKGVSQIEESAFKESEK